MKIIIIFFIFFQIAINCFSSDIETIENIDVINDSLDTVDSLAIQQNLKIDKLTEEISRSSFPSYFEEAIFSSNINSHHFLPFPGQIRVVSQNFTLPDFAQKVDFFFRAYSFDNFSYLPELIILQNEVYDTPISFSKVFLGLGDKNLNYADITYKKGNILNLKDLHLFFHYFGQQGDWYGASQTAKNIYFSLIYHKKWGQLIFSTTKVDQQELASDIDNEISRAMQGRKGNETSLIFKNRFVNLGIKKYLYEHDNIENLQFFVAKNISFGKQSLGIKAEYFNNIAKQFSYTIDGDFKFKSIDFQSYNIFVSDDNYYFYGFVERKKIGFTYLINKQKNNTTILTKKNNFGMCFNAQNSDFCLSAGKLQHRSQRYIEISWKNKIKFKKMDILFDLKFLKIFSPDELSPKSLIQDNISFVYNLPYQNKIKFGIEHLYWGEYRLKVDDILQNVEQANMVNIDLRFEITQKFEIRFAAKNLTHINSNFPFEQRLFTVDLMWLFVN